MIWCTMDLRDGRDVISSRAYGTPLARTRFEGETWHLVQYDSGALVRGSRKCLDGIGDHTPICVTLSPSLMVANI